jgi:hypothetical protein
MPFIEQLSDLVDCSNLVNRKFEDVIGSKRVTTLEWECAIRARALAQTLLPVIDVFQIFLVCRVEPVKDRASIGIRKPV